MKISKKVFFIIFALTAVAILAFLSPKKQLAKAPHEVSTTDPIEITASNYLRPLLHIGESTTNIINRFGVPTSQHETAAHKLIMDFYFSPDISKTNMALKAGVGGVVCVFTNNCLSDWAPVYRRAY
ncbi:MAG: hypothetical protein WCH99_16265 [Verrucomicrobiota bacterium]